MPTKATKMVKPAAQCQKPLADQGKRRKFPINWELGMIIVIFYMLLPAFFIWFGTRLRTDVLGVVRYRCWRCGQDAHHVVINWRKWFTLYFIPVIPIDNSFTAHCSHCQYQGRIAETQANAWFPGVPSVAMPQKTAQQWIEEGNAHLKVPLYEHALFAYEQSILLAPHFPFAHYQKGLALISLLRYEEAIASLDQAIRLAPDVPGAYYQKGVALERLGRSAEAQAAREKAKQLSGMRQSGGMG